MSDFEKLVAAVNEARKHLCAAREAESRAHAETTDWLNAYNSATAELEDFIDGLQMDAPQGTDWASRR